MKNDVIVDGDVLPPQRMLPARPYANGWPGYRVDPDYGPTIPDAWIEISMRQEAEALYAEWLRANDPRALTSEKFHDQRDCLAELGIYLSLEELRCWLLEIVYKHTPPPRYRYA